MGDSTSEFRDALVGLIDSFPEQGGHPSADRWLDYQRGALAADEEERLQEHLARCRDCCDLAEAAAAFAVPEEAAAADPSGELTSAAVWRTLRPQLEASPGPPPDNVRPISSGLPRRDPRRLLLPLAASFLVALVGLSAWTWHQQRAPTPNVAIVYFAAVERLPGTPGRTVTAGSGPWVLVFNPEAELPAYRLTLRDAATGRERNSYDMTPDEDLALTLEVPDLPPGRYEIEIAGTDGSGRETHVLNVTEPDRDE
jgi:hypothetical protein